MSLAYPEFGWAELGSGDKQAEKVESARLCAEWKIRFRLRFEALSMLPQIETVWVKFEV